MINRAAFPLSAFNRERGIPQRHDIRFEHVGLFFTTVDLLTNHNLLVYSNQEPSDDRALQRYNHQRKELFAHCE